MNVSDIILGGCVLEIYGNRCEEVISLLAKKNLDVWNIEKEKNGIKLKSSLYNRQNVIDTVHEINGMECKKNATITVSAKADVTLNSNLNFVSAGNFFLQKHNKSVCFYPNRFLFVCRKTGRRFGARAGGLLPKSSRGTGQYMSRLCYQALPFQLYQLGYSSLHHG